MSQTARRPARYEDILGVPEHLVAEILDGELVASPRPAIPHARAASTLGQDLAPFDRGRGSGGEGPGGWWLLDEPEVHLGADVLVPDLAGWRRERLPALPDTAFLSVAPDWVCEVLSPRTEAHDRGLKRRIYAREGVGHLWLVDPSARTLEVFRLAGGFWVLTATFVGDEPVSAEPFEALTLDPARWWPA